MEWSERRKLLALSAMVLLTQHILKQSVYTVHSMSPKSELCCVISVTLFTFQPFTSRGVDSLLPLETKIEREYDPLWPNDYEKVSVPSVPCVLTLSILKILSVLSVTSVLTMTRWSRR